MPTVGEVLDAISVRAPWGKAAGWDVVGLQLGDPAASVEKVAVAHEVTEEVVGAVLAGGPELLITYHPLIFGPLRRLVAGRSSAGRALRLAKAGVAVAVAHTNFDVARGGCADALAESIGLQDLTGFAPVEGEGTVKLVTFLPENAADDVAAAMAGSGGGRIGNYRACSFRAPGVGSFLAGEGTKPVVGGKGTLNHEPEVRLEMVAPAAGHQQVVAAMAAAHPYEEPAFDLYSVISNSGFLGRVGDLQERIPLRDLSRRAAEALGTTPRVAGRRDQLVGRVAVVPGSGADFIPHAAAAGAEAIITGDISHHRAKDALDAGLLLIDPGHAATERPGVRRLAQWVAELAEVLDLSHLDPSPWSES